MIKQKCFYDKKKNKPEKSNPKDWGGITPSNNKFSSEFCSFFYIFYSLSNIGCL